MCTFPHVQSSCKINKNPRHLICSFRLSDKKKVLVSYVDTSDIKFSMFTCFQRTDMTSIYFSFPETQATYLGTSLMYLSYAIVFFP